MSKVAEIFHKDFDTVSKQDVKDFDTVSKQDVKDRQVQDFDTVSNKMLRTVGRFLNEEMEDKVPANR